jgi:putative acetyltransferase
MDMTEPIQIRRERPDHPQVTPLLDALDAYLASLYAAEDNHILDLRALQAPDVSFFAAWSADRVVGCGALRRMPGEAATGGEPYGEIKRMFVDRHARGRRTGARLLAALEGEVQAHGLALALLETGRDQAAAVRLYECAGYARRGPFAGYPDNGRSVFYMKRLAR